jgi:hypothetical protein
MATLSQVELAALGYAFNKAISNGLSDVDLTLAVRVMGNVRRDVET